MKLSVRDRQHQCIYLKHFTVFAWQTEPVADYNRTLLLMLLLKLLSLSHCRWLDGLLSMRPTKYRLWRIRIQKDAVNSQLTGSAHYLFPDNSTSWNAGVFPVNTATSSASLGLLPHLLGSLILWVSLMEVGKKIDYHMNHDFYVQRWVSKKSIFWMLICSLILSVRDNLQCSHARIKFIFKQGSSFKCFSLFNCWIITFSRWTLNRPHVC